MAGSVGEGQVSFSRVASTWWPLAASWLLMSAELPVLSAVVARLENPAVNLAAYGSVVFPIALIIEAPVIMLLAASTALSRDLDSYLKVRGYMMKAGLFLTGLHLSIALTPAFDVIVQDLIRAPSEVLEPARIGFLLMTPWTWSIAYRRFNQGILIRYGHSKVISTGTVVRLFSNSGVLGIGYLLASFPGIVVATTAVSVGVIAEAVFVGIRVRPVVGGPLTASPPVGEPITIRSFLSFYIPLALTSLLMLVVQPVCSAALSRMQDPLQSLAVWPVVFGLMFMLRCLGHAYQEVVVALSDEPGAAPALRRFALILASSTSLMLVLIAATPLSGVWFETISGLRGDLSGLARFGIWFGVLLPALSALQNWLQGMLVHRRETRKITLSVVIYLLAATLGLAVGVVSNEFPGLYVGLAALSLAAVAQVTFLYSRCR